MSGTVYVISDLHLGGEPEGHHSPGFQICGPVAQERLADFLNWVARQRKDDHDVQLVVNASDAVDFLAEKPFEAFTADQGVAERKLEKIMESTRNVWNAFRDVVQSGAEVVFTLGNHDLEFVLPKPRALLRKTLGSGRVDLLFDNRALVIGTVLIEHGNRYDGWNVVKHDSLRGYVSKVSRREAPKKFPVPPGSRLVIDVMNELKTKFRFIDLLKPEQEAVTAHHCAGALRLKENPADSCVQKTGRCRSVFGRWSTVGS